MPLQQTVPNTVFYATQPGLYGTRVQHTFHNSNAKYPKFDGRQANLEAWFSNALDMAAQQGLAHDDQTIILNAKTLIDLEKSSPATFLCESKEIRDRTSWQTFKELFRAVCAETPTDNLFEAVLQLTQVRWQPNEPDSVFLAELERHCRLLEQCLQSPPWVNDFPQSAVNQFRRSLQFAMVLRELTPDVRRRVLASNITLNTPISELRRKIITAGGWSST